MARRVVLSCDVCGKEMGSVSGDVPVEVYHLPLRITPQRKMRTREQLCSWACLLQFAKQHADA